MKLMSSMRRDLSLLLTACVLGRAAAHVHHPRGEALTLQWMQRKPCSSLHPKNPKSQAHRAYMVQRAQPVVKRISETNTSCRSDLMQGNFGPWC